VENDLGVSDWWRVGVLYPFCFDFFYAVYYVLDEVFGSFFIGSLFVLVGFCLLVVDAVSCR